jgi:hypothetical protein
MGYRSGHSGQPGRGTAPRRGDAARRAGLAHRLSAWTLLLLLAGLGAAAAAPQALAQSQAPRVAPVLPAPDPAAAGAAQAGAPPVGAGRPPSVLGGNPPPAFGGAGPQPAVSPPLPAVAGTVPWDLLAQVKTVRVKDRFLPEFAPAVARLDRQDVKVVGFMMPLEAGEKQGHFLLTVTSQTCAFCIPAGPEGMIEVRMRTPLRTTFDPVVIAGRLAVLRDDPLGVFYRITDAESVPMR